MADVTLTADGHARLLRDGNELPLLGLGVWQVHPGQETETAVRWALELGYRHIDTAQGYGNEESVGKALLDSGRRVVEVSITTNFLRGPRNRKPEARTGLAGSGWNGLTSTSATCPRADR